MKSVATRGLLECLIVSPRARQREVLSRAATASGWASVVCSDAATARHLAQRIVVKLAFIDLEEGPLDTLVSLQELAADLSRMGCPLLVVCGADGDRQQEIWARQLGAWLYLPGMAGVEEMTQLCEEAAQRRRAKQAGRRPLGRHRNIQSVEQPIPTVRTPS